jgi:EAL and modified HD-GYP domain-containing signal transduction protein
MTIADQSRVTTAGRATFSRQPVVHPDRSVYAYALRGDVDLPAGTAPEVAERLVEEALAELDLGQVAHDRPVIVRATRRLLDGSAPLPQHLPGMVVEVPLAFVELREIHAAVAQLSGRGVRIALGDYHGTAAQDALLPLVSFVKVDAWLETTALDLLVGRARETGVTVIAERANGPVPLDRALAAGVELLQGQMFPRPSTSVGQLTAGQLQCLELMRLLSSDDPDRDEVTRIVAADPGLSVRLLHLVNSSAFGLGQRVDSVQRAVVLAGPRHIAALATASLVGAKPTSVAQLWSTLARAIACRALSGSESGYTVGLLSAVASQLSISLDELVERSGVSAEIGDALRYRSGRLGAVLSAVVAHEKDDDEDAAASGVDMHEVGHAYLDAVAGALTIATSLAVTAGA